MKNIYVILNKISFIILFSLFSTTAVWSQCPVPPTTCTNTVTSSSNQTTGFTLAANQSLCIQSGTYTGSIGGATSSSTIYVYAGATFNPSAINNFGGRLVNCGRMTLPSFSIDNSDNLTKIENYGVATINGTNYGNRFSTWINGLGAKMTFSSDLTLDKINFTNNGNVLITKSFTMNTSATNLFINHDSLTALGNISLNASILNDGYLFAKGSNMTLNATGNISNKCYFKADGDFTINTSDTIFIDGFLWTTGKAVSNALIKVQGSGPLKLGPDGFLQGPSFEAASTPIVGSGNFRFTGFTRASIAHFGIDGKGLNFYDTGLPAGIFDQRDNAAHPLFNTVTKNPVAARDSTFIPSTCSPLIKCNTPQGGAGNDTIVCGPTIDLKDANPGDPYYFRWGVESGNPSAATIDPITGVTSNMSNAGKYYFRLYKFTNPSCFDIVEVTVTSLPSGTLAVVGDSVCRTATTATVRILNADANVTYEAYKGVNLLGSSSAGPNASLPISINVSGVNGLTDGANTITFKAKRPSCGSVDLVNSAIVVVSPLQDANASVTATSPICSGGTSKVTISATQGITYTVRDKNNNVIGSAKATTTGSLDINVTLTAVGGPDTNTLSITATVAKCANVVLNGKPKIIVSPVQDLAANVTATPSTICSGNTSDIHIAATKGITYTVKDQNGRELGKKTATATGDLVITTIALTATGSQASFDVIVTAESSPCSAVILNIKPKILVNPLLVPSVTLAADKSTTICAGTTIKITATPTNGGTSPVYQWRVNGVNTGAPTTTASLTRSNFSNGDVISVLLKSNAICATPDSAKSTSNISLTVNPLLTPAVTISSAKTTVCANEEITVTATPVNPGTSPTYQWFVNGVKSGVASSSNVFKSTSLTTGSIISVTLKSNAICATPDSATSAANITFTVNPNETPTISISTPNNTVCAGSKVSFTSTIAHGGTAPTYQWKLNGANINGANGPTYETTTLVNGDKISLDIVSNAICKTTANAASNVITMNIGTNLVPTVSITTASTTVCAGNSVLFTASVANGGLAPTYQWKINGVNAGAVTTSNTFTRSNLADGDQVSVDIKSNETCVITTDASSNSIKMTVNPVQPTNADVTVVSPICHNTKTNITISATKGMTYTVRDQNLNIVGTGTATVTGDFVIAVGPFTAPNGPTSYTLKVTASIAGCNPVDLTKTPVVLVNPAQGLNVSVSANSPICSGESSNIVALFATDGITYTVVDENTNDTLGRGTAVANGNLNIPTKPLFATEPTFHTYKIIATVKGCSPVTLTEKPKVLVNPVQDKAATATAVSPICSGETSVVTIQATKGMKYTIKDQTGKVIGIDSALVSGPLKIVTDTLTANASGPTTYTFTITASVSSCDDVDLLAKPSVVVNPIQNPAAKVTATSPVCSGNTSTVSIVATRGITYTVFDQNNNNLGTRKATTNGTISIVTPVFNVTEPTTFTLRVVASVDSCDNVTLTDRPTVLVNPKQDANAIVSATSPICSGSASTISITATKGVTYTVTANNIEIAKDSATVTGTRTFPTSVLTATANPTMYTFVVTATTKGCTPVKLNNEPLVEVNKTPSAITATGGIFCSNADSITLTLSGTEKNVSYRVYRNNVALGNAVLGVANKITVPNVAPLVVGIHNLTIKGTVPGCVVQDVDTARVVINQLPSDTTSFTADNTICANTETTIRLKNPQVGVTYTVIDIFNSVSRTLAPLNAAGVGSYKLTEEGVHTIAIKASIQGCTVVDLKMKQTVLVNKAIDDVNVSGVPTGPICENANSATITIDNPIATVDYNIYEEIATNLILVNKTGPLTSASPSYTITNIAVGLHSYKIKAKIGGCDTSTVFSFDITVDKNVDTLNPKVDAGVRNVCLGSTSTISVKVTGTQANISYQLQRNGVNVRTPQTPNAAGDTLVFGPFNDLVPNTVYEFSVTGTNGGCGTVAIASKDTVIVSDSLDRNVPKIDAGLSNVCLGTSNTIKVRISNTQKDVTYHLQQNGRIIESKLAVKKDTILEYLVADLDTGRHVFTALISNAGCDTVQIKASDEVVVSDSLKTIGPKLEAGATDVCEGDSVTVILSSTQKAVSYTLLDNGKAKGAVVTANADGQTLKFGTFALTQGGHLFTVKAKNAGCDTVLLSAFDSVYVNKTIDTLAPILEADTNVICVIDKANLTLTKTQIGVTYRLYNDGVLIDSAKAVKDNDTLYYKNHSLTVGTHTFTVDAYNNACSAALATKATIKVNGPPEADSLKLKANHTVLCNNDNLFVKVFVTKNSDYSYYLIDTYKGAVKILGSSKLGNSDTLTFGGFTQLGEGIHQIQVVSTVQGCASDTSKTILEIKINNSLDVDKPVITADKNVICEDGSVTISITNTAKGDKYTLSRNGSLVVGAGILNPQEALFDGDTLVYGPISGLKDTIHIFSATTTNPGCGTYTLKDTAKVIVNPIPSKNTKVTSDSIICLGNTVRVKVDLLQDVTYKLYHMVDSSYVAGPSASVLITPPYTKAGKDSLFVVASIAGCADVRLEPNRYVTINEVPNINLNTETLSTCLGSGVSIPLWLTDSNWTYKAHVSVDGNDTTVVRTGNDTLRFAFEGKYLNKEGLFPVSFEIDGEGKGCPNTVVNATGGIRVIYKVDNLHGDDAICEARSYGYSIPLVAGVSGYIFDVKPVGLFDSTLHGRDSINVTWNADVKNGSIIAFPITTTGVCSGYGDTLNVNIEKPYDGSATIGLDRNIVCVGDTNVISINNLKGGVPRFDRVLNNAILIDSIIAADPKDNKYIVKYNEPKTVTHRYTIYSACAGTQEILDTTVIVLPIPHVSAGEYPVIMMKDYPREVVLDGSASSQGDFIYKWTTKPAHSVTNSNSIIASFVPEQTMTQVKLTVTNANGMCPNSDSTNIVVDLGIFIPNVFTPNNDGDHDNWYLENVMAFYPNVKIDIYSKWGTLVYHSDGYSKPWDGTKDSQDVPAATYYYVIDLKKPNFKPIAGSVTIIR